MVLPVLQSSFSQKHIRPVLGLDSSIHTKFIVISITRFLEIEQVRWYLYIPEEKTRYNLRKGNVCNKSNAMGATREEGNVNPSGVH